MDETTELEEGEACYYKDDGNNVNLDSLSYFDERIQHVLGHFQKDFEGGVSAENLGAKFGGYGSFLPAHERSPPFWSHPKTPQRNYSSPSPNNVHIEASSHTSRPPSNVPTSRLGTASHTANSFHNLKVSSFDNSMKQDVGLPSNLAAEGCQSKHDDKNKSHNSTDQRTLKLRIKVKSDYRAQKNAAIYSNLGLGNSPSSSMGNSPEGSGGVPPISQETAEESPTGIIQVMTDFPVPGSVLLSPLHDSLLYLIRKEKVLGDNRSVSSLNGHQEHCSMSTDESDSFVGNGQLSKRNVRIVNKHERQLELKHMSSNGVENDMTIHMKKRVGNRTPDRKEFLSNDLKCTPLSSSVCDAGEIAEATGKTCEILKGFNKEEVKGGMASAEAMKEESLESISCQDLDKSGKQHTESGFGEEVLENKQASSNKDKSMNTKKCKAYMTSEKAKGGVIKCKVDQDPQKHVISQKKKLLLGGKNKLEEDQSPSNAVTVAKEDNSGAVSNIVMTEKRSAGFGVSSCGSKMNKMKLLKDNKVRDSSKNSSKGKGLESVVHGMDPIDRPCGHQPIINAKLDNFEEHSAYGVKVNERPSANKMGNQIVEACVKDASNAFPVVDNNASVEMVPAATAAPCLIEEHWVCCDSCQKWRLLPLGMMPEQLPDKWLCSMLNWLPGMNQCEISEEETTKALRAWYQVPISDGQNNMQNQATEATIVMSSSGALQSGLNNQNHNSDVMSDRRKKKPGIKEKMEAEVSSDPFLFSTSTKKGPQDSVKNRRLTVMDQHPPESNPMKKTSSQHPRKLHNSVAEKHMAKESDKQISRGVGNGKHIKLKRKMEVDQYKCATPKKSKTHDMYYADKLVNRNMDLEKVSSISRNDLPAKVNGMDMRKYDEYCLSENAKDKLVVPMKNEGVQTQVLPNCESLNLTNNNTKDGSVKKRKLKERQDNDNHGDTFSLQDNDSTSGSRKEKMCKVLSKEGKSVVKGEHKLNRKGKVSQVCLSGGGNHETVDGEVRSADKEQELRKHRKNLLSQPALEGIDPLGRDLGSGQPSLAATSSSSKVSGSHKARTNFDDVKNSPVGSVTSSPLRASNMDKLILAGGDASGKDDGVKRGLSSLSSKKCLDNRGEKQIVKMKEKVSFDLRPESQKLSLIKHRVGGASDNCRVQSKTSYEVNDDHLLNGGVSTVEQHGCGAYGTHCGDRMKSNQDSELYGQKSAIGISSLQGMVKDRRSGLEFDRNTMKASVTENGHSRIGGSYELAVDTNDHASGHETINEAKPKRESDHIRKKNFVRHQSSENGKQSEPKQEDFENSILREDASCTIDRKRLSQENLPLGSDGENRALPAHMVSRDGPSKVFPPLDSKGRRETLSVDSRFALESQKEGVSSGPVHAPSNGDVARLMKCSVDATNRCSGKFESDRQPTVSSPVRTSSSQNAFNTLKEATKLKDTADHYKNSGFEFESNETYFDAALKFLHGASPLENCQSDSFKHGEMSQMHIYATTAKLFESCAHEYERRQELAAAALAYKCMEVAYMRVVYSKTSSTIRDHHELQSSLQMVAQGESPSSSASDLDSLNNQAAGVKMALPRGTGNHVAGNQVISACNRPNFVRLLDFTQDVNLAMEASRKCQITFVAANKIMEEARNGDCITSVRKVIDFSFQDVDELVHLVRSARKAISHAGLVGARE